MRLIVLAALIPLAACGNNVGGDDTPGIAGTGSGGERSFAASDFTAVDLRGPDDVDVRVGSGFSVRAEGDAATLDKLKIERVGDTLRVGRVREAGIGWGSKSAVKIYVTMPRITAASLAGSGNLGIDRVEGTQFAGDLAGSGDLSIGAIRADDVKLSLAGSGNVTAAGTARRIDASIAGSGDIDAGKLVAAEADVSVVGSGNVTAAVDGPAKVNSMGSGDVDLGPKARCSTTKMGSGEVRCG